MSVAVKVVESGYRALPKSLKVTTRATKALKTLRFSTPAKLYSCETILERLAQDLQDMTRACRPFSRARTPGRTRHTSWSCTSVC